MIWRGITLLAAGLAGSIAGLWASDREPPVRVLRVNVLTPIVAPGGELQIEYEVERIRQCGIRVDRTLYDAPRFRIPLEDLEWGRDPGPLGRETLRTKVAVPRTFSEGPADYRTVVRYECNPLHRFAPVVVGPRDIAFQVRGPPTPMPLPVEIVPPRNGG